METPERRLIHRIYRNGYVPWIALSMFIIGIPIWSLTGSPEVQADPVTRLLGSLAKAGCVTNGLLFIAIMAARLRYRLNPHCPVCGQDAINCKLNRNSLFGHPKPGA